MKRIFRELLAGVAFWSAIVALSAMAQDTDPVIKDLTTRRDNAVSALEALSTKSTALLDEISSANDGFQQVTDTFHAVFGSAAGNPVPIAIQSLATQITNGSAPLGSRRVAVDALGGVIGQLGRVQKQAAEYKKALTDETDGYQQRAGGLAEQAKGLATRIDTLAGISDPDTSNEVIRRIKSEIAGLSTQAKSLVTDLEAKKTELEDLVAKPEAEVNVVLKMARDILQSCLATLEFACQDESLRLNALKSIASSNAKAVRDALVGHATKGSNEERRMALGLLFSLSDPGIPEFASIIRDTSVPADTRILAAQLLVKRAEQLRSNPKPKLITSLLGECETLAVASAADETSRQVQTLAVEAIAVVSNPTPPSGP